MKVAHFCDHRDDDDDSFLLMMMKTTTTKMKKKEEEEDKKKNMNVMAIDNEAGENLFIQAFGYGGMDWKLISLASPAPIIIITPLKNSVLMRKENTLLCIHLKVG